MVVTSCGLLTLISSVVTHMQIMEVRLIPRGDSFGPIIPKIILDDMKREVTPLIHSNLTTYNLRAMNPYAQGAELSYAIAVDLLPVLDFLWCPTLTIEVGTILINTISQNTHLSPMNCDIILSHPQLRMLATFKRECGQRLYGLDIRRKVRGLYTRVRVDDDVLINFIRCSYKNERRLTIHLINMGIDLDQVFKSRFESCRYHKQCSHIDDILSHYSRDNEVVNYIVENYRDHISITESIINTLLPDPSPLTILNLLKRIGINWNEDVVEKFLTKSFHYCNIEVIDWILTNNPRIPHLHKYIIDSDNHQFIDLLFKKGSLTTVGFFYLALNRPDTYTLSKIDLNSLPSQILDLTLTNISRIEHIKILMNCKSPYPITSLVMALITHCQVDDLKYILTTENSVTKSIVRMLSEDGTNLIIHLKPESEKLLTMVELIVRYSHDINLVHLIQNRVKTEILNKIIELRDREFAAQTLQEIRESYPSLSSYDKYGLSGIRLREIACMNRCRILNPVVNVLLKRIEE